SFLLDGNRWGQAVDRIYVRAFHLIEELASVSGQGFHVAALALSVNGVESEGRLARTTQSGNDRERVTGDFDVDIFEVMLARPANGNLCNGHWKPLVMSFGNVDGSPEMLESGSAHFYIGILS